jgi:disulfide oxidoreductase YuzD
MTKLNSDEALLDLLNAIREYDYQATLDAIVVLKDSVIEDGVPQVSSVYDEYSEQTLYGKFLD